MEQDVGDLTVAELCLVWRRSHDELQRVREDDDRADLTYRRGAYLDEFERRDPAAFARWLHGGVPGVNDPARFFLSDRPDVT